MIFDGSKYSSNGAPRATRAFRKITRTTLSIFTQQLIERRDVWRRMETYGDVWRAGQQDGKVARTWYNRKSSFNKTKIANESPLGNHWFFIAGPCRLRGHANELGGSYQRYPSNIVLATGSNSMLIVSLCCFLSYHNVLSCPQLINSTLYASYSKIVRAEEWQFFLCHQCMSS